MQQNQKEQLITYKTLLTKDEYVRILEANKEIKRDVQVNHYFDTTRYTLKASEVTLRVKETETKKVLILERKKGFNNIRLEAIISDGDYEDFLKTGIILDEEINKELQEVIKGQKLVNYLTLSTFRVYIPYKQSRFAVDKVKYCNVTDYEIEYQTKNVDSGKTNFIQILNDYDIVYKKSQSKLKRAYDALKNYGF